MLTAFKVILFIVLVVSVVAAIDFEGSSKPDNAQRGTALAIASIAALTVLFVWI